jgi:amidase
VRDVLRKSALEQAALIRRGLVSSVELTRAYLERIARLDPQLSAFVQVLGERALAEAKAHDRKDADLPPFWGVPTAVKDLNAAKGSFSRFGSRAFERLFSPVDDATVAQLRRAGFVIVGKTATSELGALPVTEPDIHPPTRNPWDLARTAGGSSGGAGAAVAAGLVPIAQGSDGAGSIRIPAALNHLVGIKPSRGRVENSYGHDDRHIIYTCGPLARTVRDAAAMLDAMAGLSVGTPHWAPRPAAPFLELCERRPHKLRLRVVTTSRFTETEPEIAAATLRIAHLAESLGHEVKDGAPQEGSLEEFLPVWQRLTSEAPVHDWALTQPVTRWLAEAGAKIRPEDVRRLCETMAARVLAWFGDADAWITPSVAIAPPFVGEWKGLPPAEAFARAARLGAFTAPLNVGGQPAVSIPAGFSSAGHPIGVQLVGRSNDEGTILALARQLEREAPWDDAWPPLAYGGA